MTEVSGLVKVFFGRAENIGATKDGFASLHFDDAPLVMTKTDQVDNSAFPVWQFEDAVFVKGVVGDAAHFTLKVNDAGMVSNSALASYQVKVLDLVERGAIAGTVNCVGPDGEETDITLEYSLEFEHATGEGDLPGGTLMYDIHNDHPGFRSGLLDISIERAEDITDDKKADPYVEVRIGKKALCTTNTISNTNYPVWMFEDKVGIKGAFLPDTLLEFNVYDDNYTTDTLLGQYTIPVLDFMTSGISGTQHLERGFLTATATYTETEDFPKKTKVVDLGDLAYKNWKKSGNKAALKGGVYYRGKADGPVAESVADDVSTESEAEPRAAPVSAAAAAEAGDEFVHDDARDAAPRGVSADDGDAAAGVAAGAAAGAVAVGAVAARGMDSSDEEVEVQKAPRRPPVKVTGTVEVRIVKAVLFKGGDAMGGEPDPFVVMTVNNGKTKVVTTPVKSDSNGMPVWNHVEKVFLTGKIDPSCTPLCFSVYDKDMFSNDTIGKSEVPLNDLVETNEMDELVLPIVSEKGENVGDLFIGLTYKKILHHTYAEPDLKMYEVGNYHKGPISGVWKINLESATGLEQMDGPKGINDPYAIVSVGTKEIARTPVLKDALEPEWNFSKDVFVTGEFADDSNILIAVWDKDMIGSDHIGETEIKTAMLFWKKHLSGTYPLTKKDGKIKGSINASISFEAADEAPEDMDKFDIGNLENKEVTSLKKTVAKEGAHYIGLTEGGKSFADEMSTQSAMAMPVRQHSTKTEEAVEAEEAEEAEEETGSRGMSAEDAAPAVAAAAVGAAAVAAAASDEEETPEEEMAARGMDEDDFADAGENAAPVAVAAFAAGASDEEPEEEPEEEMAARGMDEDDFADADAAPEEEPVEEPAVEELPYDDAEDEDVVMGARGVDMDEPEPEVEEPMAEEPEEEVMERGMPEPEPELEEPPLPDLPVILPVSDEYIGVENSITGDEFIPNSHEGNITDTCFVTDNLVATAGEDGQVYIFNIKKNKNVSHFRAHRKEPVASVQTLPGSTNKSVKLITVGAYSRTLKLWEVSGRKALLVRTMQLPKSGGDVVMSFPVRKKVRSAPEGVPEISDDEPEEKVDPRSLGGFVAEDGHAIDERKSIGTGQKTKKEMAAAAAEELGEEAADAVNDTEDGVDAAEDAAEDADLDGEAGEDGEELDVGARALTADREDAADGDIDEFADAPEEEIVIPEPPREMSAMERAKSTWEAAEADPEAIYFGDISKAEEDREGDVGKHAAVVDNPEEAEAVRSSILATKEKWESANPDELYFADQNKKESDYYADESKKVNLTAGAVDEADGVPEEVVESAVERTRSKWESANPDELYFADQNKKEADYYANEAKKVNLTAGAVDEADGVPEEAVESAVERTRSKWESANPDELYFADQNKKESDYYASDNKKVDMMAGAQDQSINPDDHGQFADDNGASEAAEETVDAVEESVASASDSAGSVHDEVASADDEVASAGVEAGGEVAESASDEDGSGDGSDPYEAMMEELGVAETPAGEQMVVDDDGDFADAPDADAY